MTTLGYGIFVLLFIAGVFVKKRLGRQSLMLLASYVFYAEWGLTFLTVLVVSSVFNYYYGAFLRRSPTLGRLWGGVAANILLLGFYKTSHLIAAALGPESHAAGFLSSIAMPLGISFWTFQALSYLFDVYRQEEVEPSLVEFSLYMAFWPTVIMGPICRLPNMLPQFRNTRAGSLSDVLLGLKRIVIGLFMKLVVSQALFAGLTSGTGVSAGFDRSVNAYSGLDVWFLAIGFGFQLFFDFAGYSNIAIGGARIFGFHLEENFDSPFLASTPSEFWTRWHMSLSSWIRDYVFVPLATVRREVRWRYFALLLSMTIFGLWHGAKATFVLWGTYQGILLVLHRVIQKSGRDRANGALDTVGKFVSWPVSFLAISLGWIFFRANDLKQALAMYRAILSPSTYGHPVLNSGYYFLIMAVLAGYFGYHTICVPLLGRMRSVMTDRTEALSELGITRGFVSLVSLIPMVFILLFALLIVHGGSEGVSPFVYAVF